MENKNFMTLTEDELYEINGGVRVEDWCKAGATVAAGAIFGACGGPGIAGAIMMEVLPLAEPADPKPGDVVNAGGYTLIRTETGGLKPADPVTYGIDIEKHKNTSSSNTSSQKSSNKSSK